MWCPVQSRRVTCIGIVRVNGQPEALDGLDDADGVLCLDVWRHLFGNPSVAAEAWTTFLEGPIEEARQNAGRRAVPYNRVVGWAMPPVTVAVGGPPG